MGGLWRRRRLLCNRNLSITAVAVFSTIFCQVGIAFFSVLASLREFVRLFLAFEFVAYTRLVTLSSSSCLNAQCSWYRNRTERQIDNVCPRLKFQRANRTPFYLKRIVMGGNETCFTICAMSENVISIFKVHRYQYRRGESYDTAPFGCVLSLPAVKKVAGNRLFCFH